MTELPQPLKELVEGIEGELLADFELYRTMVGGFDSLFARVLQAIKRVRSEGVPAIGSLTTFHNELCVAIDLLRAAQKSGLNVLDYEPPIDGTERKIDFRWQGGAGNRAWIEVKTIQPVVQDDSRRLTDLRRKGRFPSGHEVHYGGNIGGELFHDSYAARGKMLEYAIDTEEKIAASSIDPSTEPVTLVFCGNGFAWTEDELEDFHHFYSTGEHRFDDPYRDMEDHFITQQGISFTGSIDRLAYFERPTSSLRPTKKNWRIRSPGIF